MFDDAQVSLSGEGKARTVNIALKPLVLKTMNAASFENFVWWTPEELTGNLHSIVPLYRGVVPDAGNLGDLVQAALVQMLAQKGVTASVAHVTREPSTEHPRRVVDYSITEPAIKLTSVSLNGTPASLDAAMQKVIARATHSEFTEGERDDTTEAYLLSPARNAGYIAASFTNVQRVPVASAKAVGVAFSATLVPGEPYKVASLDWTATPVYSAADFVRDNKLRAGDVASENALLATEAHVLQAYHEHGYLDAYLEVTPAADATAHTVAYTLAAQPGEVYRVHTVTPLNLAPEAQAEFDRAWSMKPGAPYNEQYVAKFINNNTSLPHLARYSGSFQASADPQTHLVDLTVTFAK